MRVRPDFDIRELVPPHIWDLHEQGAVDARWFLRPETLDMAQGVRDRYARRVEINNWLFGGELEERGYRVPSTDVGATYSQHKLGCAIDFEVEGMTADEVREDIARNEQSFRRMGVTAIESGEYASTWVHMDCRPTHQDQILVVTP